MKFLSILPIFPLLACLHASASDNLPSDPSPSPSPSPIPVYTRAEEAIFASELLIDWAQSTEIRGYCAGRVGCTMHETNPLLPDHPSRSTLAGYFILSEMLHAEVCLGEWGEAGRGVSAYVRGVCHASLILEAAPITHNQRIGLRVRF